ncbi:MAG: hypothetical protein M1830_003669, partial [Pleopsidium flavum]
DRFEDALGSMFPDNEAKVRFEHSAIEDCELFDVPGEELKFTEEYQEGDFIIYNDWLGVITETYDEVTIRLGDNGVVVVEDSAVLDMEPPIWRDDRIAHHPIPIDLCYPGQFVSTKKGNLRRGRWKFGAYDPSVPPKGYVVDVRIIEIEVRWLTQNVLAPGNFEPVPRPPDLIDSDVLESGKVVLYDRGKPTVRSPEAQLQLGFTAGSDIAAGDYVRFKDTSGAAVKYDGTSTTRAGEPQGRFYKIPRSVTLGYDMNVFKVIGTETQVSVLWQDTSVTQEISVTLLPYLNVDDHDVWPGEIVALKVSGREESDVQSAHAPSVTRPQKVGVVQSVNAEERLAGVRWFKDPAVDLAGETKSILIPGSRLGVLSDDSGVVSFYEIVAYPGLTKRRGDFVLVVPEQSASLDELGAEIRRIADSTSESALNVGAVRSILDQALEAPVRNELVERGLFRTLLSTIRDFSNPQTQGPSAIPNQRPTQRTANDDRTSESQPQLESLPSDLELRDSRPDDPIDWFGEIVDLGFDGLLTIRLGALKEVRDVRIPLERVILVMGDDDGEYEADSSNSDEDHNRVWDDRGSDNTEAGQYDSEEAIEETYEYEGGERLDGDGGDEMWTTDDENATGATSDVDMSDALNSAKSQSKESGASPNNNEEKIIASQTQHQHQIRKVPVNGQGRPESPLSEPLFSAYPSAPSSFSILDTDPPTDHYFLSQTIHLTASGMKRIHKEHKILNSSLPDGIFVRTWEARLDLLRVLIVGPQKTPYGLAPFIMDFQFGSAFPLAPPYAYFHSWTGGIGRINPNLYEDGKICLSLLGTWPADAKNEGWSTNRSSMLQILVSLMGLVLVKEPYYNEAGFDALIGTEESQITSAHYTERAFVMAKGFVRHALQHSVGGFEDVLSWLYLPGQGERPQLLRKILDESKGIIRRSEAKLGEGGEGPAGSSESAFSEGIARISSGALILLRKHVVALEDCLVKAQEAATAE